MSDCFASQAGRLLALSYVQGLLSAESRKNVEALALRSGLPPRTLQRFLESIKWDERLLVDNCQRIVAEQHAADDALGLIDETGVAKSGSETAGVQRQYNGNRGKIENAVVHVGIAFSTGAFHALLDARVYLPEEWANDLPRRKKTTCRTTWFFKPSRRSPWIWYAAPWRMASASKPGLSTNSTVAAGRSWTI